MIQMVNLSAQQTAHAREMLDKGFLWSVYSYVKRVANCSFHEATKFVDELAQGGRRG